MSTRTISPTGTDPKDTGKTVAIIGAGFAGLIAARELERLGFAVEIFEARDRIGGRTWTEERMGHDLEMGGTWVHWMQPFVWAEIVRYGANIVSSPVCEEAYWVVEDDTTAEDSTGGRRVCRGTEADVDRLLGPIQAHMFDGSRELFPNPHAPWEHADKARALDTTLLMSQLDGTSFTAEEKALVDAYWSAGYNGPTASAGALMAKHWAALSDHRLSLLDEQTLRFKLAGGMRGIYTQIAADVRGPINLNTAVTGVEETADGVTLHLTKTGSDAKGNTHGDAVSNDTALDTPGPQEQATVTADYLVTTVPVGAMKNIDFASGLPDHIARIVEEGWNCTGLKIWVKAKGHRNVLAYAPTGHPIALLRTEYFLDDGTMIMVGFGPDHTALDLEDVQAVQKAVDVWGADLEVVDCTGHDWNADKFTGQTWTTPKPGQFIDGHPEHLLNGRVVFAGSDWAAGWNSFVDGAIETGFRAAREIAAHAAS